jgi:ubiquinone biosynthesis protein
VVRRPPRRGEALAPTPLVFSLTAPEGIEEARPRRSEGALLRRVLAFPIRRGLTQAQRGRDVRDLFEAKGGLWIKLAQLLALRRDLFDPAFCAELAGLHDRGEPVPFPEVRRVVEEDLGQSLETVFEWFEEKCVASASTGQTHRAKLRAGGEVGVKVQRPGLPDRVRRDFRDIRRFLRMHGRLALGVTLSWDDVRWELEQALAESLDYRLEATYMIRSRRRLRRHHVFVPRVVRRLSHRRVQVKEWISGVSMETYIAAQEHDPAALRRWLAVNEVDPEKTGRRIFTSMMRQVLEESYYHGYWHPGNVLLLREGWVAIVDFWAMSAIESSFRRKYALFSQALFDREYTKAADLLLLLCPALPPTADPDEIRERVVRILSTFEVKAFTRGLPFAEKSLSAAMGEILRVLGESGVAASWAFMRLDRAFSQVERSMAHLAPDSNLLKIGARYWYKARRRAVDRMKDPSTRARGIAGLISVVTEGPDFIAEQLLFQSEGARRRAKAFRRTTTKIAHLLEVLSGVGVSLSLGVAVLLALVYLAQHHATTIAHFREYITYVDWFPYIDTPLWVLGFAALFDLHLKLRDLRRRFARAETRPENSN